jgi:uracil-DNA glycosylase
LEKLSGIRIGNLDKMLEECPVCNTDKLIIPAGRSTSPVLVVGEFLGDYESAHGMALSGAEGTVFRREMTYLGVDISKFRIVNILLHKPNGNARCVSAGFQNAIAEAKGKKAILLIGSTCVSSFCDTAIGSVCGAQVHSPYLSAPIIYACVNPAIVFKRGGIGELRLALQKFILAIKEI